MHTACITIKKLKPQNFHVASFFTKCYPHMPAELQPCLSATSTAPQNFLHHSVFAQAIHTGSHTSQLFLLFLSYLYYPFYIGQANLQLCNWLKPVTTKSQISPSQEVLKLCHVSYSRQHRYLSSWAQMSQTPLPLSGGLCKHPPGLIGSHPREQ